MTVFSSNPRISFAAIRLEDTLARLQDHPDKDFTDITTHRDGVIRKYQMVFSPARIPKLTKDEFLEFLLYRNNHHWTNINRVGKFMVADMGLLREALTFLLDESIPVEERINQLRPERYWSANTMVSHLGTPVLTAILMIMHPDRYGVWNNTSDAGLKAVQLWERRWAKSPTGKAYAEMNAIYLALSAMLKIDLWTLDALWWLVKRENKSNGSLDKR
jgi:hypothetical protein